MSKFNKDTASADVCIGLPRALMFHKHGVLWERFFKELGCRVVVSPPTDREIFEAGEAASIDECCLASKIYIGHAAYLMDKCDFIFVPAFITREHRRGFCTKHQSLPDLVRNTFDIDQQPDNPNKPRLLSCEVGSDFKRKDLVEAYVSIAHTLGKSPTAAAKAFKIGRSAQKEHDVILSKAVETTLKSTGDVKVAVVAHPYVMRDDYIAGAIMRTLRDCGATPVVVCDMDEKSTVEESFVVTDTMPWATNRQLTGGLWKLKDKVDGAILVSAFPCGPDSLANDLISRKVPNLPKLIVVLDGQSGEAGLQTRIESFVDILTFRKKGGYLNG